MTDPTTEALRQLAVDLIRDGALNAADLEECSLRAQLEEDDVLQGLAGAGQDAAVETLRELLSTAVVTVGWPDEQPQDEPCRRFATEGDRERFLAMFGDRLDDWFTPEFVAYVRHGQPQDGPEPPRLFTDIDRDTTPFLRVRAFIDAARQKPDTDGMGIASVLDRDGVMHWLTEDDVESLLEDVGEMQEKIDRLIGEAVEARQPQDGAAVTLDGLIEAAHRRRPGFDEDVRAVAAVLAAVEALRADARGDFLPQVFEAADVLEGRFADRVGELEQRDATGGGWGSD